MSACVSKRGFFTLRNCREPAAGTCDTCSRPMCSRHLSVATESTRCLDCVARLAEQQALRQPLRNLQGKQGVPLVYRPPAHPDDWAYEYRHRYYRSHRYSPFYTGDYDPYYDDYDLRSFDRDLGRGWSLGLTDDGGESGKTDWGDS